MAYNHGKEERKWRLWKEAEEKILRAYGVDENIIEEIRIYDRAEFNSDRRFYRRLNDMEEYIEKVADNGLNTEIKTVSALLDEVENEHLYAALLNSTVEITVNTTPDSIYTNAQAICNGFVCFGFRLP